MGRHLAFVTPIFIEFREIWIKQFRKKYMIIHHFRQLFFLNLQGFLYFMAAIHSFETNICYYKVLFNHVNIIYFTFNLHMYLGES